ncbi:MAG: PEP-CTERM sorting domain-containing protein [Phycisphaeraceae bacterium]
MKTRDKNDQQRLMAYLAAAGMGAFAFGANAEAGIIHTPVEPALTVVPNPGTPSAFNIDFDNDGTIDGAIVNSSVNLTARSFAPASTLASSGSYYARSFTPGSLIDGSASPAAGAKLMTNRGAGYDFVGQGNFLGYSFEIDGNTHYGWVQVDVSADLLNATVTGYAYESTPDTGIVAGAIPEPTSLALLAAGAGALGLRRRDAA